MKYTGHFKNRGAVTVQLHCDDGWVSGKHRSHIECHEDRRRFNQKRRKAAKAAK